MIIRYGKWNFYAVFAIIILEIMENKQLKNRIQHDMEFNETMRELEDAKQAKDDFMANISHEIRTPLNSIIGIGSELLDAKVDDTTKEQLYDITVAGRNLMSWYQISWIFQNLKMTRWSWWKNHITLRL